MHPKQSFKKSGEERLNDACEDTNVPIRELTAGVGQFQMTETERRLLVLLWTLDGATAPTIAKVYADVGKNISEYTKDHGMECFNLYTAPYHQHKHHH